MTDSTRSVPDSTRSSLGSSEFTVVNNQTDMITENHMRCLFHPRGIAVVGATDRAGSVGRTVLENLYNGYATTTTTTPKFVVCPVNPTRDSVLGRECSRQLSDIKTEDCEMAVVITPAAKCLDVIRNCALKKSIKVVVILAAGFKEIGEEGLRLERDLIKLAVEADIAVVGPNCLGIMVPGWQMNATFAASSAPNGHVAFISQSGAMCTAVLDWSLEVNLGFSAFVSIGSMAHVDFANCLEFLGNDEQTKALILYMETIGDARRFVATARRVCRKKPIVVVKAGKTAAAAAAAVSHTGSLAGSHDAFVAVMERAGCLVVDTIDELQNVALLCATQPMPANDKITIVTNAGGPGVLCTDAAALAGLDICELDPKLVNQLNELLPPAWSHHNPIDLLGDAKAPVYGKTIQAIFENGEPQASILVVLSPQSVTEPGPTADAIVQAIRTEKEKGNKSKPLGPVACAWMGGSMVESGRKTLLANQVPCFAQPDIAAKALALVAKSVKLAQELTPVESSEPFAKCKGQAESLIAQALKENRTILTETESKNVMKAYGIPVAENVICQTATQAAETAARLGFPCVLKLNSETITHKTDVGGVKLNLNSTQEVHQAFLDIQTNVLKIGPDHFQGVSVQPMLNIANGIELLLGSSTDPQLGPVCLFGTGGCFVEIFRDVAMAVPPLCKTEAARLVAKSRISKALQITDQSNQRFKGCPIEQVYDIIKKFSHLICDLPAISECEINPLLALQDKIVALDARVVLHPPGNQGTRSCLA